MVKPKEVKDLSKKTPAEIAKLLAGRIEVLDDVGKGLVIEAIPTNLDALDLALGCGGIPKGRIIELFGNFGHGKSSLALHFVACVQQAGGKTAYIDAEHALDPAMMDWFKINRKALLFNQPSSGEEALDLVQDLMRSRAVTLVVVDSVASLVPQYEIERSFGEPTIGLQARMMSSALRKLSVSVAEAKAILVFVNQTRAKIGVFMGNNTDTPGGQALKFYAGQRLEVRRTDMIKNGSKIIGMEARVRVVKNKVGVPFRSAELKLLYGRGWSCGKANKD